MLSKDKPYRKFIILSSPRSGTHMLRTALRNHVDIKARTEVFNPDFLHDRPFGPDTPAREILNKYIYKDYPPNIKMVGFIIHRSGTPFGNWPDLWQMLQEDKEIYVISLRRRNLLRRYLSYQVMRTFRGVTPKPLYFDPKVLKSDFIYQRQETEAFDQRFAGHPLITIYYEDLCADYHATMKKVQGFLKVKPQKLWPDVEGKPKRKLSEAIANFEELNTYFAQTEWATFFNGEDEVVPISKPERKPILPSRQKQFLESLSDWLKIRPYQYIRYRYNKSWPGLLLLLVKYSLNRGYHQAINDKTGFYNNLPNTGIAYYSQRSEELIIRSFFQDRRNGVFLDVGCAWPLRDSNTCYLEKHLGWSGVAVDANPINAEGWKKIRPKTQLFKFIVTDHFGTVEKFYKARGMGSTQKERWGIHKPVIGKEVLIPTITLTKLLDNIGVKKIDFLSMDIEQSEPQALAGFDIERFQPELVCIEHDQNTKEKILAYFEAHHYKLLTEYESFDTVNWYFIPQSSINPSN